MCFQTNRQFNTLEFFSWRLQQIGKLKLLGNTEFYRWYLNNNVKVYCILSDLCVLVHKRRK